MWKIWEISNKPPENDLFINPVIGGKLRDDHSLSSNTLIQKNDIENLEDDF